MHETLLRYKQEFLFLASANAALCCSSLAGSSLAMRNLFVTSPFSFSTPQEGEAKHEFRGGIWQSHGGVWMWHWLHVTRWWWWGVLCVQWYPVTPTAVHLPALQLTPSICFSTAAAVIALLLVFGLVTASEMLLQPPASVKQSPQRPPNGCLMPWVNAVTEQKLNIQGLSTVSLLWPYFLIQ